MGNLSIDWRAYSLRRNVDIETFIKIHNIKNYNQFSSICESKKVKPPPVDIVENTIKSLEKKLKETIDNKQKSVEKVTVKKPSVRKKRTTKVKK